MEIKSRVTRFAGLLCIAGALQGFPVIYSANPGGIISVARQGTYHLTGWIRRTRYRSQCSGKRND